MSWEPTADHYKVVPDAIPIPHSRRHQVIRDIRNSSREVSETTKKGSHHKAGPDGKGDASTMTDRHQRKPTPNHSAPMLPRSHHPENRGALDNQPGETTEFK